ncbi:YraN family protein [Leifsonia shinshuensis]|uniref:YraN family protein n=1 Tax=Leifsonia shinshuensis TaxID=150026 RepID=UPI001F50E6C7|nr:YraN family protein [Leifsonia shinshuensis]MCI0155241.1 YraN family protein [Leifsonia shinshuensis]
MAEKDRLGREGESLAARWLEDRGFTVVERNWRCAAGELDLIVRRARTTVFVEVKTRSSIAYGHPFEAITAAKAARLRRLAAEWCRAHGPVPGDTRIDAIAVLVARGAEPSIEHLSGVA